VQQVFMLWFSGTGAFLEGFNSSSLKNVKLHKVTKVK